MLFGRLTRSAAFAFHSRRSLKLAAMEPGAWAAARAEASASADCAEVVTNLRSVQGRDVTLIAVSKTKPLFVVAAALGAGQLDFGENYIQELCEKSAAVAEEGESPIRWHFIGKIQSNKVRALCGVKNLHMVHTVHSAKLASSLDRVWAELRPGEAPLRCFVQVNTSGEESKGGCEPSEATALARTIAEAAHLELEGFMCIGKYSGAEGDASPDFKVLADCRAKAAAALGQPADAFSLSMGMSHDFETAIACAATHVRVGSTIFGARDYTGSKPAEEARNPSPKAAD